MNIFIRAGSLLCNLPDTTQNQHDLIHLADTTDMTNMIDITDTTELTSDRLSGNISVPLAYLL